MGELISGLSVQCSYSTLLFLCQYPAVSINCSFVVWSEVWNPDCSNSVVLSQDVFGYSESFAFPYKL